MRAETLRSPIAATVTAHNVGRYSQELEIAVYFCCLEALQNAGKHALGASKVTVALIDDGHSLAIDVRDDGHGFDTEHASAGSGLGNMADRLAAVGGELTISSTPGRGTSVRGRVGAGAGSLNAFQPRWPCSDHSF